VSLALRLTLIALLLRPVGVGGLRAALLVLAVAGLLLPRARRSPLLWLGLAGLASLRVWRGWPLADNHAYLLVYWCLAIAIALRVSDPARVLAWNGRMLIGLAFGFAVMWKSISPDYLDGRFFRIALVEDPRLEWFTTRVAGVDPDTLEARRAFLAQHVDGPGRAGSAPPEPARLRALALTLTWATFLLEAAVAAVFLAPLRRLVWLRHALLLAFCATTYVVAPVASFGWLLLAMGVSLCEPDAARTRLAYLGTFALLVLYYHAPWLQGPQMP